MEQEIKEFCNYTVERLGKLVGEIKVEGLKRGFTEEQIKKIWKTIFEIMNEKMK